MKSYDYDAAAYDGAVYCVECLPVDVDHDDVEPVFADSEWAHPGPTCDACGAIHDYVTIQPPDTVRIVARLPDLSPVDVDPIE